MLSKGERKYLENPEKVKKPNSRRNFEYHIRKKVRQAMKDLTLVFNTMDATRLRFYQADYYDLAIPLMQAIQGFNDKEYFFKKVQVTFLAVALESARKRYNLRRLIVDDRYRQRMIDWVNKKAINFWDPPTLEEQLQRHEELKRTMEEWKKEPPSLDERRRKLRENTFDKEDMAWRTEEDEDAQNSA